MTMHSKQAPNSPQGSGTDSGFAKYAPCSSTFCSSKTLSYCSPAHGGWGIVRVGMLVPESYQLFVCPFACGRHGAIGAIDHGIKDRLSYLYIDEADIVSGRYEDLVIEATDELLQVLGYRPRALMIFVSCLDDLLATDHEAFLSVLRAKYPDMRFTVGHMNPIQMGGKVPPHVSVQSKIYGLLDAGKRVQDPTSVNIIGNHVPLAPESELVQVLAQHGYTARQIGTCTTFEDFQMMAASSLNIVVRPTALQAAQQMKQRLGIDYLYAPLTHDTAELDGYYQQLSDLLFEGSELPVQRWRDELADCALQVLKAVGDKPISVDYSATNRPFTLAKTLHNMGFAVKEVMANECIPLEADARAWLEDHTNVIWYSPTHHTAVDRPHYPEVISIGFESGYYNGSQHMVPLVDCETLYGYHGMHRILEMIDLAAADPKDAKQAITDYGLVV